MPLDIGYSQIGPVKPGGGRIGNLELYERIIGGTDTLGEGARDLTSRFAGLDSAGAVASRFGLTGDATKRKYGALRGNLSTSRARALASQAERTGSSTAVPEAGFSPIEGQYAGAFGELGASQAGEEAENQRLISLILQNSLQSQDAFDFSKANLLRGILGDRAQHLQGYFNQQGIEDAREGNFLQDIGAVAGIIGKLAGAGKKVKGLF